MINGILNVYKEADYTSHDVVAKLRGILKQKKIGHTGTLDPQATGVLPVCLGSGTKLCDLLADKSKEYIAELLLGVTTDTQDTTGTIIEKKDVVLDEEVVREAIMSFQGHYDQIPPMYSALKVNGKKLYELAREGKEIERQSRPVFINNIEILSMELPIVKIKVGCSKGTYIRTLCYDIGEKLGCGGTMKSLVRTRVSTFSINQAFTLSQIVELRDKGTLYQHIFSVDSVFQDREKRVVKEEFRRFIDNGNTLFEHQFMEIPDGITLSASEKKHFTEEKEIFTDEIRVYNNDEEFCGIYRFDENNRCYKPVKMFLEG